MMAASEFLVFTHCDREWCAMPRRRGLSPWRVEQLWLIIRRLAREREDRLEREGIDQKAAEVRAKCNMFAMVSIEHLELIRTACRLSDGRREYRVPKIGPQQFDFWALGSGEPPYADRPRLFIE